MSPLPIFVAIETSAFSEGFLGSNFAYAVVETLHVLGLALSVGLLAIADLRLLGVYLRDEPVSDSLSQLRPWILGGFALMVVTGIPLFAAQAAALSVKPAFLIKLVFIALAAANAALFEFRLGRRVQVWGAVAAGPPWDARIAGGLSLLCWAVVILCGRWIAYGL